MLLSEIFYEDFLNEVGNIASDIGEFGSVTVGYSEIYQFPSLVIEFMDRWTNAVDIILEMTEQKYGRSEHYQAIYATRGFTYDEYWYLHQEVDENHYRRYHVFRSLGIVSKFQQKRYENYSNDEKGYARLLQDLPNPALAFFYNAFERGLHVHDFYCHSYCVARTRSGKTELMKLLWEKFVLNKPKTTSLLLLDPHGEFARELFDLKIHHKNLKDFIYIDPVLDNEWCPVYNPFQIKDKSPEGLATATDNMMVAFEQLLEGHELSGSMVRLVRHCVYACLVYGWDMWDLLNLIEGDKSLLAKAKEIEDQATKKFFRQGFEQVQQRTKNAVVERIDRIVSHPIVRRFIIGKNTFDLESALNNGKVVVVNLDMTHLGEIGSMMIGRLLLSEIENIAKRRSEIERDHRPRTIVFLDECHRFVSNSIEKFLTELSKFRIHLFMAHQYASQIDARILESMLSNSDIHITGRNSPKTYKVVAPEIGRTSEYLSENIQKYKFDVKLGDKESFIVTTKDKLVYTKTNKHYSKDPKVKEYMVENYYKELKIDKEEAVVVEELFINPNLIH